MTDARERSAADGGGQGPRPGGEFGSLIAGVAGLTMRAMRGARERVDAAPGLPVDAVAPLVDIPLGVAAGVSQAAGRATGAAVGALRPVVDVAMRPPLLPRRYWPQTTLDALADRGRSARRDAEAEVSALADALVPLVVNAVLDRIDLAGIANQIVDDIDLPEIIRESSGAMASESVIGVRMQGIEADERINRIVDRLLLRRNERNTEAPAAAISDGR